MVCGRSALAVGGRSALDIDLDVDLRHLGRHRVRTGRPVAPPTPSILSASISSKAIDSGLRAVEVTCGGTIGAQAVTELVVVGVDLPGTPGGQR